MSSLPLFRIRLEANTTITSMFTGQNRGGAPTLFGAIGAEESGGNIWVVAMEWPDSYQSHSDKAAKELQHLNRFIADYRAGTGAPPYSSVAVPDSDPPDFICRSGERDVGVELTQLTLEGRAEAGAQFRPLKLAVMGTNHAAFRHLEGHAVYVSFDSDDGRPTKTFKSNTLVNALRSYVPPDFDFVDLPDPAPPNAVTRFPGGTLVSSRLTMPTGSVQSRMMGWDIVFAQSVSIRQQEAWQLFNRLVDQHDAPGAEELIVSAEAPLANGTAHPVDAVVAQAVLREALTSSVEARHIARIYIHIWGTRGIFALTPGQVGVALICGELPLTFNPA